VRFTWLAPYLSLAFAGCSGELRNSDAARAEWEGAWIDTMAVALLGRGDDIPLYQLRGAVLSGDTIVVAERSTGKLHFFKRSGEFLKSVGGLGGGPGEFDYLWRIQKVGEDIYAYDITMRRVSQFASNGSFVGSVRIDPVEGYTNLGLAGVFADGSLLVGAFTVDDGRYEGLYRRTVVLLRYDAEGTYLDSLGAYEDSDHYAESASTYGYMTLAPFGRRAISLPSGGHYYVLENNDYRIGVFDQNGTKVRELRPAEEPRVPVSPEHLEAIRRYYASFWSKVPDAVAPKIRDVFDRIPKPDTFPPYGWHGGARVEIARVSSVGDLWVLNGDDLPGWTVFTEEGTVRGHVRAFEELDVLDADDDIAVVLCWDELDVETVEVRRIRR
jgi:hypothetical protein